MCLQPITDIYQFLPEAAQLVSFKEAGAGLRERGYVDMSLTKGKPSIIQIPPKFQLIGMG